MKLQIEYQAESGVNLGLHLFRKCTHLFGEIGTVNSDKLRNIGNRITGQPGRSAGQQNSAGRFRKPQIAGDDGGQDGLNTTPIEGIGLDNQYRSAEAGFRSAWIGQISPPNFSSRHAAY